MLIFSNDVEREFFFVIRVRGKFMIVVLIHFNRYIDPHHLTHLLHHQKNNVWQVRLVSYSFDAIVIVTASRCVMLQ